MIYCFAAAAHPATKPRAEENTSTVQWRPQKQHFIPVSHQFRPPFPISDFLIYISLQSKTKSDVCKSVLESHSFEVEKQQFFVRDTREIRNIMSRWFTSFAVEKKLGHMNQNDIGRRHCQTYNFRAFLYFEGIYGISFFFSGSGSSPPSFLLFHVPVFIFSFPVPFNANFSSFAYCCAKNIGVHHC